MNNKFNIGDRVYYNTPDSVEGIVIDITYSFLNERCSYLIGIGWDAEKIVEEHEITDEKIY